MSEDLEDLISSEVEKNASMSSDAGSVSRRSIDELIKADNHLAAKRAAANSSGAFGVRFLRFVPGSPAE